MNISYNMKTITLYNFLCNKSILLFFTFELTKLNRILRYNYEIWAPSSRCNQRINVLRRHASLTRIHGGRTKPTTLCDTKSIRSVRSFNRHEQHKFETISLPGKRKLIHNNRSLYGFSQKFVVSQKLFQFFNNICFLLLVNKSNIMEYCSNSTIAN